MNLPTFKSLLNHQVKTQGLRLLELQEGSSSHQSSQGKAPNLFGRESLASLPLTVLYSLLDHQSILGVDQVRLTDHLSLQGGCHHPPPALHLLITSNIPGAPVNLLSLRWTYQV